MKQTTFLQFLLTQKKELKQS